MKRIFTLFFIVCFYCQSPLSAQDFPGFFTSNYSGVSGLHVQPANVVDGRLKFDMTILGLNTSLYNNYVAFKRSAFNNFGADNFVKNYTTENSNGRDKSLYLSNRVQLLSFLVNINRKNSFAFTWNARNYVNVDGVSPQLGKLIYEEFQYPSLWITQLQNRNLNIQQMAWAEYGLTFGHVFLDKKQHFIKGAVTVKLLQGLSSAYMTVKDLKYQFTNDSTVSLFHSYVGYGHSTNFDVEDNGLKYRFESQPSVGFDFGVVYEWRPDYEKYKYDMDGKTDLWRRDQNKYKLKVGLSVTDIGSIKFKKGSYSNDFVADINYWNLGPINIGSLKDLDDTLRKRFPPISTSSTYKTRLPMAISAQVDYHVWKHLYANLTPYVMLQTTSIDNRVHDFTTITLTPRWDHKWYGFFVPLQYNTLQQYRVGLSMRIGPLVVGTSNLGPLFAKKTYGADFHVLFKVPILYKRPHDKDGDKISDAKDKCKDLAGVPEFQGCPDRDGDHVQDSEDKCPDVAGLKELQGCPDRDGDKITDADDKCPDVAGLAEFNGCPDTDGDKIVDSEDECPDAAGLPQFMGCPDKDGDETPDKFDACPDIAGPKEYKGCPDRDGDLVLDKDDACPDTAGVAENKGCPWPDRDKDGVFDKDDACPEVAGLKENKGCPPIKVEEQKILEKAFSSLEFNSGKDVIKKVSYPSLNDLAKLMKEHSADWTLKLSGHTDNQGTPQSNMTLSEKRVKAVKKYLVAKGVKDANIITEWFGQTQPIAPNDTEAGRQKNRRVEMKVSFIQK